MTLGNNFQTMISTHVGIIGEKKTNGYITNPTCSTSASISAFSSPFDFYLNIDIKKICFEESHNYGQELQSYIFDQILQDDKYYEDENYEDEHYDTDVHLKYFRSNPQGTLRDMNIFEAFNDFYYMDDDHCNDDDGYFDDCVNDNGCYDNECYYNNRIDVDVDDDDY